MRAHLQTIALENLDLHLGIPISLDPESFYKKIVLGRRGGGCYELNGLFAELLRALGYRVDLLSGRVTRPNRVGPEFDHLALRVEVEGRDWLIDVGFGDGIREPLELAAGASEQFGDRSFRLVRSHDYFALETSTCGEFDKGYILSPVPRALVQFEAVRKRHHDDPRSWFVQTRLATIATPRGRRMLMNERYKTTEGTATRVRSVSASAYLEVLARDFGIEIDRVPRTKAEWPSMRLLRTAHIWRERATAVLDRLRG